MWKLSGIWIIWHNSLSMKPTRANLEWKQWGEILQALTCCWANRTYSENRLAAAPTSIMKLVLTRCQANRTRAGVRGVRTDPAASTMKSLTCYQVNKTRARIKTVRTGPAALAMKPHTCYQAKVGVKGVSTDPAIPAMKWLTSCQPNRIRVGVKAVRTDQFQYLNTHKLSSQQDQSEWWQWKWTQLHLPWNYSPAVKPMGQKWEWQLEQTQSNVPWNHSQAVNPTRPEWEWRQWKQSKL